MTTLDLGAHVVRTGTRFTAWSTQARTMAVRLFDDDLREVATRALTPIGGGAFSAVVEGVTAGALYKLVLDGRRELPDPYARSLPHGVHGPARVVAPLSPPRPFAAPSFASWVIYELHIGTFTPEGTFAAAAAKLKHVADLGVSAIELMPVHAFPGERGWGYDSVALYAPFGPYGDRTDLAALVDEAHRLGLAVILDVVYNHFGPAGNYLQAYSPEYFTSRHKTPWGDAPDFENPHMRALVLGNVRYWLEEYGFDALRLDATHQIVDDSRTHILRELADLAAAMSPPRHLIAEDERNDPKLVRDLAMRAVWADDFHHQARVLLTGERDGYYAAYEPDVEGLARTIRRGWLYEGQTYPPTGEARGKPAEGVARDELVYCIQNHDQIGNRAARRAPLPGCGHRSLLRRVDAPPVSSHDPAHLHGAGVGHIDAIFVLQRSRRRAWSAGVEGAQGRVQALRGVRGSRFASHDSGPSGQRYVRALQVGLGRAFDVAA